MSGPSCFLAANDVFVTGAILLNPLVGDGEGRVELIGDTCGFQVPPPLWTTVRVSRNRNDTIESKNGEKDVEKTRPCLPLPLYGQLEVVPGPHDNILRVLVPQIVHLRVIDPDHCIARPQTSRFRRWSGIDLQCNNLTWLTYEFIAILKIVFFFFFFSFQVKKIGVIHFYGEKERRRGHRRRFRRRFRRRRRGLSTIFEMQAARYTPNAGYCASIHARMLEKRRLDREHERRRRR